MAFSLTYDLEDAGWATAWVQDGSSSFEISISYLHDSLRELAEAARALRDGAMAATVVFEDEPGEMQLVCTRTSIGLDYELRSLDHWSCWRTQPDGPFEIVHRVRTTVLIFCEEVTKELEALLKQHGEKGYKKKWIMAEFPVESLRDLQTNRMVEQGGEGLFA